MAEESLQVGVELYNTSYTSPTWFFVNRPRVLNLRSTLGEGLEIVDDLVLEAFPLGQDHLICNDRDFVKGDEEELLKPRYSTRSGVT
jgi:hypothetical protein